MKTKEITAAKTPTAMEDDEDIIVTYQTAYTGHAIPIIYF